MQYFKQQNIDANTNTGFYRTFIALILNNRI